MSQKTPVFFLDSGLLRSNFNFNSEKLHAETVLRNRAPETGSQTQTKTLAQGPNAPAVIPAGYASLLGYSVSIQLLRQKSTTRKFSKLAKQRLPAYRKALSLTGLGEYLNQRAAIEGGHLDKALFREVSAWSVKSGVLMGVFARASGKLAWKALSRKRKSYACSKAFSGTALNHCASSSFIRMGSPTGLTGTRLTLFFS